MLSAPGPCFWYSTESVVVLSKESTMPYCLATLSYFVYVFRVDQRQLTHGSRLDYPYQSVDSLFSCSAAPSLNKEDSTVPRSSFIFFFPPLLLWESWTACFV